MMNSEPKTWAEAEIVAEPVKSCPDPRVLVRRRRSGLVSPDNCEVAFFPSQPVISTFTGCGGMDLGIEQAGFTTVVQHESDKTCCETLIRNRPRAFRHAALIQGDICRTPTSVLLREGNLRTGEAALVTGGPPCQGFSTAGKRDPSDVRNTLLFQFLRVVREAQPHFFILENVPGLISLAGGRFFEAFLREAYAAYYELVYGLINAANYGVPQHRVRFFCMGTRRDLFEIEGVLGSLPCPQTFEPRDVKLLWSPEGEHAEEKRRLLRSPGIRYFPDRLILRPPNPARGNARSFTRTFMDFYDRLERDEPDRVVHCPVNAA